MTDPEPVGAPRGGWRRTSTVIVLAAIFDLLVLLPYTYWRLHTHGLAFAIAAVVEGVGVLSLLGIALSLRRRGM
jgi:hypothetical protein